ncbi:UDP-N-acetylmuramoyl-tripeptide--D-alanyl-D-alanine ligase [Nocardioides sp. ChNu-153]|uniref:UDP-N-acetylmuramoyl-tripeptide--D-alanyl-D- alanine ligase n=1 Tax=unclassified Nocardioides TaxID=2615069 RepID=UPI002406517B|nr:MULTISPECIES: UDP-N-acetylmuramoyl-tripeptide--D-alanyl-D-alanine ligase [unclassified Nocardioides]MDF9716553.1 UDP-N-acetylmuramoyl-tripeptide--D-alanyl-D-alanine ligase [Nocardioides sp. ChNu-99]MDN7120894.1 UDP-N-acetylmuramoyl-tripeptide--D-alanyl-D-alanine ligase [Nocardioides sp. ChNu-153]
MIPLTLAEVAAATGGRVDPPEAADVVVTGAASLDSRAVPAGGLFVALPGERVDGHDYAAAAVAGGAAAVLAERAVGVPAVVVADGAVALGRLARAVLERLPDAQVLAVTGSQGKTGVKDYLAQVLASVGPTVATAGNLNNELGVPLTVLRAEPGTRFLVVEMGARGIGHIAYLCTLAPPRVAGVLNVGQAHVGEFGSVDNIAVAKGEIVEALPPDGRAVLNADDHRTAAMVSRTQAPVLTFGEAGDVAWRDLRLDPLGRPRVELGYAGTWAPLSLAASGAHQVANAAAAVAFAVAAGVPFADAVAALDGAGSRSRWRMEVTERADGLVVVNDAYNANPASMAAAVRTLVAIAAERPGGRSVAVLGEMRELGDGSEAEHRALGALAAASGVDVVLAVGDDDGPAGWIVAGAVPGAGTTGRDPGGPESFVTSTRDEALRWLGENVSARDVVLVKASRGAALEVVADGLLAGPVTGEEGPTT